MGTREAHWVEVWNTQGLEEDAELRILVQDFGASCTPQYDCVVENDAGNYLCGRLFHTVLWAFMREIPKEKEKVRVPLEACDFKPGDAIRCLHSDQFDDWELVLSVEKSIVYTQHNHYYYHTLMESYQFTDRRPCDKEVEVE